MNVQENPNIKVFNSDEYNYIFNKNNGFFVRWGENKQDDPEMSPYGPELIDCELTDICYGPNGDGVVCPYCYKSNSISGTYMDFETYKKVFDNLQKDTLTQIAFGVDSQCITNPDTFKIMKYTRDNDVIPNVTVANISDDIADKLVNVCGAVAVSLHHNKNVCYDSIKKLTDRGLKQTNMHVVIAQETLDQVYETFNDYLTDTRLSQLNAIVLLSLKQKGRGKGFTPLTQQQFDDMVNYTFEHNIPIGFDSCSAPKLFNTIKDFPNREELEQVCEPCESSAFSFYVNVNGEGFPCSFVEGEDEWSEGIDLTVPLDFLKDVWYCNKVVNWRQKLLDNNRNCPVFSI